MFGVGKADRTKQWFHFPNEITQNKEIQMLILKQQTCT